MSHQYTGSPKYQLEVLFSCLTFGREKNSFSSNAYDPKIVVITLEITAKFSITIVGVRTFDYAI